MPLTIENRQRHAFGCYVEHLLHLWSADRKNYTCMIGQFRGLLSDYATMIFFDHKIAQFLATYFICRYGLNYTSNFLHKS